MVLNLEKHYALRADAIKNKRFHCSDCNISYRDNYTLTAHMNSLKHNPERKVSYYCSKCDYRTKFKGSIHQHFLTKKCKNKH